MNGTELIEVQQKLRSKGILISFSGRLSQGLIEEYGEAVKTYMEMEDRPKSEVFNVFAIFIEQTQNIKNYCSSKQGGLFYDKISHSCIVTIGKTESGYFVCSGNLIENQDKDKLVRHIDSLIVQDKSALKKIYKEALSQQWPEGTGGAGVGLIDIARKAAQPIEYTIVSVDDSLSFFTLKAVV